MIEVVLCDFIVQIASCKKRLICNIYYIVSQRRKISRLNTRSPSPPASPRGPADAAHNIASKRRPLNEIIPPAATRNPISPRAVPRLEYFHTSKVSLLAKPRLRVFGGTSKKIAPTERIASTALGLGRVFLLPCYAKEKLRQSLGVSQGR